MLGIVDYPAFIIAFVLLLALPGPGNLAIFIATGRARLHGGLAATLGIILGDQVLFWTAVAGLAAILATTPGILLVVQVLGAAYLIGLGVQMCRSSGAALPMLQLKPGGYCWQAFLITLLNPKAIMFYMAFLPLFIDREYHQGLITFTFMAANVAVLTLLYGLIVSLLVLRFSSAVSARPAVRKTLECAAGMLLIGFGLQLLLSRL